MASISQLEAQLQQFNGKNKESLSRIAEKLPPGSSTIDRLISLAKQSDPPMQTAATWLLKHFQSRKINFSPSQVTGVVECITRSGSWESRLHVVQMLPNLAIPLACADSLFESLTDALSEPNKFIRAWAYTGLHALASQHRPYAREIIPLLARGSRDEAPSVRARLRQLPPLTAVSKTNTRRQTISITPAKFRHIALSLPEAIESAHMEHPDFRVGDKIFATLGYPDQHHGMVVLPPEEQERLVRTYPAVFSPAKGAWGKGGSTTVRLDHVDAPTLRSAMEIAWRKRAPKRLWS